MRTVTRLSITIVLIGCQRGGPASHGYVAPEPRPVPKAARIDTLISRFHTLRGTVRDGGIYYVLLTDLRPLAEVASADTVAIPQLVRCLSDAHLSQVTWGGQRIAVGGLCAYALFDTPYARERLRLSQFPREWVGSVTPRAGVAELRAAQMAWEEWVRAGHLSSFR